VTQAYITRLSTGEEVEISKLTAEDLRRIHFEEERWVASKLLTLKRFSQERYNLLYSGLDLVSSIMFEIARKQGVKIESFGASKKTSALCIRLVKEKQKEDNILFYEIGVGTGYSVAHVINECADLGLYEESFGRLSIKGCDIFLLPSIRILVDEHPNVDMNIEEGHVVDCLQKLPDKSVDVLYADNVFEHFLPDEVEQIYSLIARKLKSDAYVFLIIPNKYVGPSDVSKYFLPFGSKAQGFHFMEMSFNEVTEAMKKHGVHQSHCVFKIPLLGAYFIKSKVLIKLKLKIEHVLAKIPWCTFRKRVFSLCGYSYSILKASK